MAQSTSDFLTAEPRGALASFGTFVARVLVSVAVPVIALFDPRWFRMNARIAAGSAALDRAMRVR